MDHLYPYHKKLLPLLFLLMATVSSQAQTTEYAALSKKSSPVMFAASNKNGAEKIIKIASRSLSRVVLTWTCFRESVSHYVIERSINGSAFYEAGLFLTGENKDEHEYFFTDDLRVTYGGTLHYRLRIVSLDGSEEITPVTVASPIGGTTLLTR